MNASFRRQHVDHHHATRVREIKTFREAAESYVEHGGDGRHLPRVIEHLGDQMLFDIAPFDIEVMALELYPDHKNSTRNRQAVAPALAVMRYGYRRRWCDFIHVKRFREEKPKRKVPATPAWLHAFTRQCRKDDLEHLAALVLFMACTAARVTEAINVRWRDMDLARRKALLRKTKTEENSSRDFTDEVAIRLSALRGTADDDERVFGYTNRQAVNTRIAAVCNRAEISYKSSHACGRHTFATTAMEMGLGIRTTMDAGGWKSSAVFLETYVHSRENAGRIVADQFSQFQFGADL
ncbi:tyrosine-type recombinase/integrase [Shinella sp. DD12]|uniref:tyrosine-type recombinase/integrase n=1 Tax=Shinella sp. DD12 TaxID=1410620 RepID=UPI0003C53D2A|nr:tyrosine-type recombinase/integrase [Shinella sp. DD12]EYR81354.1 phage integrase family [Shinella sp. DD12]